MGSPKPSLSRTPQDAPEADGAGGVGDRAATRRVALDGEGTRFAAVSSRRFGASQRLSPITRSARR